MEDIVRQMDELNATLAACGDTHHAWLNIWVRYDPKGTVTEYTIQILSDYSAETKVKGLDFSQVLDEFLRRRTADKALMLPRLPAPVEPF
jgi:hypothetical protein